MNSKKITVAVLLGIVVLAFAFGMKRGLLVFSAISDGTQS